MTGIMLTATMVAVGVVVVLMLRRIARCIEAVLREIDARHREMQRGIDDVVRKISESDDQPKTLPMSSVTRRPETAR